MSEVRLGYGTIGRIYGPSALPSTGYCIGSSHPFPSSSQGDQIKKGQILGYVEQLGTHFAVEVRGHCQGWVTHLTGWALNLTG